MDYFSTQANVYNSTFGNPVNPANMNQGWGIDPSLLTPSYEAPYRPSYAGGNGFSPVGRPSWGQAGYNISGIPSAPKWGSPTDNMRPSVESFTTKPFDAAAWTIQNIGIPYAAYSGINHILGPKTAGLWAPMKAMAAGKGAAAGFGTGLADGLFGKALTGTPMAVTRGAMGLTSGLLAPLAASMVAADISDRFLIGPYTDTRNSAKQLQTNFANQYFGEGSKGIYPTGKGISYSDSNIMGGHITRAGIKDMMFSKEEYGDIGDMAARSGLMDNVKGSQLTQRVKDVAEQVKLLMAVSKDPTVQNALEELSKLNLAGADLTHGRLSTASGAYTAMGTLAAMAGTTVQRLQNTVGAQGQYMFQSAGMTPYLGQIAAGNTYAGFAAAQRQGLLSPATLARMGGVEGASQSAMTAQMLSAQSPLAMMASYNRFIAGQEGSSTQGPGMNMMDVISKFAAHASSDPIQTRGAMALYGTAASGNDLARAGNRGAEDLAVSGMNNLRMPRMANGKYSAESLAAFMQSQGIPDAEIRAYINQRITDQDSGVFTQKMDAITGTEKDMARQFMEQTGTAGGWINRNITHPGHEIMKKMQVSAAQMGISAAEAVGASADWTSAFADRWNYGKVEDGWKTNAFDKVSKEKEIVNGFDTSFRIPVVGDWKTGVLNDINNKATSGDEDALAYLKATTAEGRSTALSKLTTKSTGIYSGDLTGGNFQENNKNRRELEALAASSKRKELGEAKSSDVEKTADLVTSAMNRDYELVSRKGMSPDQMVLNLHTLGAVQEIKDRIAKGELSPEMAAEEVRKNPRYNGILAISGGNKATNGQIDNAISSLENGSLTTGLYGLADSVYKNSGTYADLYGKSASEREEILKKSIKNNGGFVTATAAEGTRNMTDEEKAGYRKMHKDFSSMRENLMKQYDKGEVSFDQVREKLKGLDKVDAFGIAVDKFGHKIDKYAASVDKDVAPSMLTRWLPSKDDKVKSETVK